MVYKVMPKLRTVVAGNRSALRRRVEKLCEKIFGQ